jgi:putative glycosyltransferase (TIGR04372 family)
MIIFWNFVKRQVVQIIKGDSSIIANKLKKIYPHLIFFPLYVLAIPIVIFLRLISPLLLIRWQGMITSRIGHFAGNLELYLCEKESEINIPSQFYFDIFFIGDKSVCNQQLFHMWKRVLRIWPKLIMHPIMIVNKIIPGGNFHEITTSSHDRDVHNLYDKSLPHLFFTKEEEKIGASELLELGIPKDEKFICLTVRDSAYMPNLTYHAYRDGDIQKYILAAEELASRGYYVIRMGAKVNEAIKSQNPRIIDYATNGSRSDFMDIFLGAKCTFCISTSTGFDAIPTIFRKPIVFITVPIGYLYTFSKRFLSITKHHISTIDGHELTLDEIFNNNLAFALSSDEYKNNEVYLVDNSPEEIRDLVIEMDDRIKGYWIEADETKLHNFKKSFLSNLKKDQRKLHGNFDSLIGSKFLEKNSFF